IWASTGFVMVVLSAAIKGIPTEILEAARADGAGEWAIFWRIMVPMLSLPISIVSIWLFINVIKVFDIIYVMTGGGPGTTSRVIAFAVIWLVPTLGLAITSFRPNSDILSSGWWTALTHWHWTLHNYGTVIHANGMGHAWVNSVIITIPATLLPLTLGALAAFGFAWVPFPFRDTIFLTIVALMIVPIQT